MMFWGILAAVALGMTQLGLGFVWGRRYERYAIPRDEAKAFGVPYEDMGLWPPLYAGGFDQERVQPVKWGSSIMPALYSAAIGDVVPVFTSATSKGPMYFYYRVKGFFWAGGEDHIASPRMFWVVYDHAERL